MTTKHRDARREAQGVGRSRERSDDFYRPPYEPSPSTLALLRATWGRRDRLDPRERDMIWSFLQRIRGGPLTQPQLEAAVRIGASIGIGHDAPEETNDVSRRPAPQPWGPLPLRPPGR